MIPSDNIDLFNQLDLIGGVVGVVHSQIASIMAIVVIRIRISRII